MEKYIRCLPISDSHEFPTIEKAKEYLKNLPHKKDSELDMTHCYSLYKKSCKMKYEYNTIVLFRYMGRIIGKAIFTGTLTNKELEENGIQTLKGYNGGYVFLKDSIEVFKEEITDSDLKDNNLWPGVHLSQAANKLPVNEEILTKLEKLFQRKNTNLSNIKKLWKDSKKQKQVTFLLEQDIITKIDTIIKAVGTVSATKLSRGDIMKYALDEYYEAFKIAFIQDHGYDPEHIKEMPVIEAIKDDFNLVIFPAHYNGYQHAFLNENKWYYVRMNANKIEKIQYVACYVGSPVSQITHYAKVSHITKAHGDNEGKYIIHFSGSAIELPKNISLGELSVHAMRSPRYTTLEKLLRVDTLDQLF